jgi:DNA-directed RNA polymerase subunit RPC12/RpoP
MVRFSAAAMLLLLASCGRRAPDGFTSTTLTADLTYTSARDGAPVCDLDISVEGDGDTNCPTCDFRFFVTPAVTRDDSPGWCHPEPGLTWLGPLVEAGWLEWDASDTTLTSGWAGHWGEYGWEYEDETVIACPDCEHATAVVGDGEVAWAVDVNKTVPGGRSPFWPDGCESPSAATSAIVAEADATGEGSVGSGAWLLDVWKLDGAEGRVQVVLDTVDAATASQLQLYVVDPARCLLVAVPEDDWVDPALSVSCSFGALSCPSVGFNATAGTWYLGVRSPDATRRTGYTLRVEADGAPVLTLLDDDTDAAGSAAHTDVISAQALGRF